MNGKENTDINIIFAADNAYTQHLGVAIYSLLENFRSAEYRLILHVIEDGITADNKKRLSEICSRRGTEIHFWPVDKKIFASCPEIGHLKLPTYFRLLIPDIIDPGTKKVIYLDSDLVVAGDIVKLYEQDLDGSIWGATEEVSKNEVLSAWAAEGLSRYFNAGVLLIDLEKWRANDISSRAFSFIAANQARLKWADQDALNLVGRNDWHPLDWSLNLQIDYNQKKISGVDPVIIHYVGRLKPWHFLYSNYYSRYYWQYLRQTPWRGYRCPDFRYRDLFKKIIKKIPGAIYARRKLISWLKN